MTRVLLGTDSVHTTAAACDYLGPRLDSEDTVIICSIPDGPVSGRDAGDAGNVARTRLVEPTVEVLDPDSLPGGDVSATLRAVAAEPTPGARNTFFLVVVLALEGGVLDGPALCEQPLCLLVQVRGLLD